MALGTAAVRPIPAGLGDRTADATAPSVSIVMPCLNEEETVGTCVEKAMSWLARTGTPGEVLVVDNGSTDRSAEIASAAGARVIHERRRGYGQAYLRGFSEARGDYIVMGDADDTYDFSDLDPLIAPLADGADMVLGQPLLRRDRRQAPCRGRIATWAARSSTPSSGSSSAPGSATARAGLRAFRKSRRRASRPAVHRHGDGLRDDRERVAGRVQHRRSPRAVCRAARRKQAQHRARRLAPPPLPAPGGTRFPVHPAGRGA